MARTIDMGRAGLFGIALLLFLAVVGPSCLLSASVSMAAPLSPMHEGAPVQSSGMHAHNGGAPSHAPSQPSDCGSDDSDGACPHADSGKLNAVSVQDDDVPAAAVLTAFVEIPVHAPASVGRVLMRAERRPAPPPAHLTPLRL
jgi:hypothetical protein